jgi:hypothetical protein
VHLKDSIFQASSPTRHTAELGMLIKDLCPSAAALILFTDGGPDHNNKHMSVRLGLLALFLELDLDTMVVMRTAPTQSWSNPVERVMSVLNLGLQGVALAREEMVEEYETEFKKCNGMNAVRNLAQDYEKAPPVDAIPHVAKESVGMSRAEDDVPLADAEREDGESQRGAPTSVDEEDDGVPCDVDVEIAEENMVENVNEPSPFDDLANVPMSQLDPGDDDNCLGSDASEEVVGKVGAEENVVEKGNDPSSAIAPVAIGMSVLDQDDDDDWLGSDADDEVVGTKVAEENEVEIQQSHMIDLTDDADNPLIDAYFKSIQKARDTIAGQWRECTWGKKSLNVHAPATTDEVITLSSRPFPILVFDSRTYQGINKHCVYSLFV